MSIGQRSLTLFGAVLLAGCSAPGEDVRVTLCKGLVLTQGAASDWQIETRLPAQYRDLEVRLQFTDGAGRQASAQCFYPYRAVEDDALALADPLSVYGTAPTRLRIDGREFSRQALAEAVSAAMGAQAREWVEGMREGLEQTARELGGE
ncbi:MULTISPECIES: hypothetical protein [Marichromatium]|uniref:Lipoprotein n=1 Tax=Marichromatium gracile TaxID=1048 RepID=A0A4R4A5V6_MARGR|nr:MULTISPECIES: hypothetical protein [Marichromatium]MBK1709773.1 hypothetical protein [Marichromatium gracile]RNE92956.1 hypothetical protein EBL85_09350 [Marichromatium sp. AB32]TCW33296.1 hypothetical protein EDC29_11548 [Marichromatium gracile]